PNITDDTGFAERVNSIPKYVASRTLKEPLEWNASLIKGDLGDGVASLKRQHRGNLISFGCGELAYELVTHGLADEIHFWVNPAVWGSGDRAFHGRQVRLQLIATTAFDSGVTLLCYRPAPDQLAPLRRDDRPSTRALGWVRKPRERKGGTMAQARRAVEAPIADLESERGASKPLGSVPKQRRRHISAFWRHYLQMAAVM